MIFISYHGGFHMNETLKSIMTRKSIRKFTDKPVADEEITTILKAGMSGPSACNCRPWSFIVVKDREMLNKMADAKKQYSDLIRKAAFAVLVCGDLERAIPNAPEYWVIDGSIAIENMILAAHSMGIGSCWVGIWPRRENMDPQAELFMLPESAVPHSIVAFGYPEESEGFGTPREKPEWEASQVHFEKW